MIDQGNIVLPGQVISAEAVRVVLNYVCAIYLLFSY